jgi:flagella basal body P-ring formation protein FlgA
LPHQVFINQQNAGIRAVVHPMRIGQIMGIRSFYMAFAASTGNRIMRNWKILLPGLCSAILFILPTAQASTARQNLQVMQDQVEAFLTAHYDTQEEGRVEIKVSNLDPRLILPKCDQALSMIVNDPSNTGGNLTVQTRCDGEQSWSIYVPAQVALFRPMAVASRNLNRGDVVDSTDISIEIVNVSQLRQGYLARRENIVGKEVQRAMNKGEAFRGASLDSPLVIKRGDEVSIEIQAGMIAVSSFGTAMANGRIGQRIRVRNSQSDRIVSAEVVDAGKVKTSI